MAERAALSLTPTTPVEGKAKSPGDARALGGVAVRRRVPRSESGRTTRRTGTRRTIRHAVTYPTTPKTRSSVVTGERSGQGARRGASAAQVQRVNLLVDRRPANGGIERCPAPEGPVVPEPCIRAKQSCKPSDKALVANEVGEEVRPVVRDCAHIPGERERPRLEIADTDTGSPFRNVQGGTTVHAASEGDEEGGRPIHIRCPVKLSNIK